MAMTIDESMAFHGETRFTPGQEVVATREVGPYHLTAGKVYTVEEFIEPVVVDGFRFPAYVKVTADHGRQSAFHTYRFRAITKE